MSSENLQQIFAIVGPALLAFFVGHFHVLISPAKPATPATPPVAPVTPPASPDILPFGQGGFIQILSMLLNSINAHPAATPDQKAAAASAVIDAAKPLLVAVKAA